MFKINYWFLYRDNWMFYILGIVLSSFFVSHGSYASNAENLVEIPPVDERPALPFPPSVSLESICGEVDELQHVELYDASLGVSKTYVAQHERSTVQFQWKSREEIQSIIGRKGDPGNVYSERWCTGTLFQLTNSSGGNVDYILTAAHCFSPQTSGWMTPQVKGKPLSPEKNAALMVVNLNYQVDGEIGSVRKASEYGVHSLVEHSIDGLDYAIVRLGDFRKGDSAYVKTYATLKIKDLVSEETLAIIQHPQGEPKKIEAGTFLVANKNDLFYSNIDTHGGSSGSGVRDENGHVVGVHTNGGCTRIGGANKGVSLKAISNVSSLL